MTNQLYTVTKQYTSEISKKISIFEVFYQVFYKKLLFKLKKSQFLTLNTTYFFIDRM